MLCIKLLLLLQGHFPQILLWTACYDALPVTSLEILELAVSQREVSSSLARGTCISQMYQGKSELLIQRRF
jgi:hypothetical protein